MPRKKSSHAAPRSDRASLRMIAERLSVSMMTVSRALRGKGDISDQTRQRVLEVADELRYRPNNLVLALRSGRSNTVGVMISPSSDFSGNIIRGIHDELIEHGSLPILHFHGHGPGAVPDTDELKFINRMLDQRVDGIILWPSDESVSDLYLREVWERGVPLVTVDRQLGFTHADFVGTDDELGGRLAAEHLLSLGHRRVVHLAGERTVGTYEGRRIGFEQAIAKCKGATYETITVSHGNDAAIDAGVKKVLRSTKRPTALFAAADVMVPAVYDAVRDMGLSVPGDLSVVGYSDTQIASLVRPRLTTLRQDTYQIGRQAATLLMKRVAGSAASPQPTSVRLAPSLVVRDSTAPPKAR